MRTQISIKNLYYFIRWTHPLLKCWGINIKSHRLFLPTFLSEASFIHWTFICSVNQSLRSMQVIQWPHYHLTETKDGIHKISLVMSQEVFSSSAWTPWQLQVQFHWTPHIQYTDRGMCSHRLHLLTEREQTGFTSCCFEWWAEVESDTNKGKHCMTKVKPNSVFILMLMSIYSNTTTTISYSTSIRPSPSSQQLSETCSFRVGPAAG